MTLPYDLPPLPYPTPDADAIAREIAEIAALCVVTVPAMRGLSRLGLGVAPGDPWPFRPEDETAPVGSRGWWNYAATVLAVAHNTRLITTTCRNAVLDDAYLVALAKGGVR